MNPVIRRIYSGYTITELETQKKYVVTGQMQIRKTVYYYVKETGTGETGSFSRDALMDLQAKGKVTVTLETAA